MAGPIRTSWGAGRALFLLLIVASFNSNAPTQLHATPGGGSGGLCAHALSLIPRGPLLPTALSAAPRSTLLHQRQHYHPQQRRQRQQYQQATTTKMMLTAGSSPLPGVGKLGFSHYSFGQSLTRLSAASGSSSSSGSVSELNANSGGLTIEEATATPSSSSSSGRPQYVVGVPPVDEADLPAHAGLKVRYMPMCPQGDSSLRPMSRQPPTLSVSPFFRHICDGCKQRNEPSVRR